MVFQFSRKKAIEVILYLAQRIPDADIYSICKLLYFSDKTSLEKYGRFIFGESYVAMKEGATPSFAYDILKEAESKAVKGIRVKGVRVKALRKAELDLLSQSDIECLDKIIELYGNMPGWYRWNDAHDTAWRKSWSQREGKNSIPIPLEEIVNMLDNSDELLDYLYCRDEK